MNDLERFIAICKGQKVDFIPIIGLPGASGASFGGAWGQIYQRLLDTGMPLSVKGWDSQTQWDQKAAQSWSEYWGTLTPLTADFWPCQPCTGVKYKKHIKDNYEIIEYNTGAVTRQVIDNENAYSMPEFVKYHITDRKSWQFYKELNTPGQQWPKDKTDDFCKQYDGRTKPLFMPLLSTWGMIRDIAGTERACIMLYDEPQLAHDIIDWQIKLTREYLFPLVERLKPEIIKIGEDCCYNHGMLISPEHFQQFCAPVYKEIVDLARANDVQVIAVDTDGCIKEFIPLLDKLGVNAVYPIEAKANDDLFTLRKEHPEFIFFGWLEKEVVNEGNEHLLENEIMSKVPPMLEKGRYFPNLDHSLQPMCTFKNFCKFMDTLHKTISSPLGQFPRE